MGKKFASRFANALLIAIYMSLISLVFAVTIYLLIHSLNHLYGYAFASLVMPNMTSRTFIGNAIIRSRVFIHCAFLLGVPITQQVYSALFVAHVLLQFFFWSTMIFIAARITNLNGSTTLNTHIYGLCLINNPDAPFFYHQLVLVITRICVVSIVCVDVYMLLALVNGAYCYFLDSDYKSNLARMKKMVSLQGFRTCS